MPFKLQLGGMNACVCVCGGMCERAKERISKYATIIYEKKSGATASTFTWVKKKDI